MRLTDIMSAMDLAIYPQIALLIFVAIFINVLVRVFSRRRAQEYQRLAELALHDEPAFPTSRRPHR
jgi:hypothetical protein